MWARRRQTVPVRTRKAVAAHEASRAYRHRIRAERIAPPTHFALSGVNTPCCLFRNSTVNTTYV